MSIYRKFVATARGTIVGIFGLLLLSAVAQSHVIADNPWHGTPNTISVADNPWHGPGFRAHNVTDNPAV